MSVTARGTFTRLEVDVLKTLSEPMNVLEQILGRRLSDQEYDLVAGPFLWILRHARITATNEEMK